MLQNARYDLISMGRACLDLYANEVGVPFLEVKNFAAYVGGCPANIAVGSRRLGLEVAMLSAVGDDPVGDFVCKFLQDEGIDTSHRPQAGLSHRRGGAGHRAAGPISADLLPRECGRHSARHRRCAGRTAGEGKGTAPLGHRAEQGTQPQRHPVGCRAGACRRHGDRPRSRPAHRTDQWHDPRAYGVTMRAALPSIDVVVGTEDEIKAVTLREASQMPTVDLPGFPVEIYTTLGAGDAFASGFLYGYIQGWDLVKAARLGNATGAIVVTRHACANSMPTMGEVMAFVEERGGF